MDLPISDDRFDRLCRKIAKKLEIASAIYIGRTNSLIGRVYTRNTVTLEIQGRGQCKLVFCPVRHNGVDLFAVRARLDLDKPASTPVLSERSLRRGDEGEDVKALKQALIKAGFTAIVVDGKFGRGTEQAVRDFQRKNGLTADGAVGPQTRAKLAG